MLKAIETVYDGYKFRSRLEARWAVFFKTLGVKYEYEKEGFELGDGVRYLPDFWLPEQKCWIEIKGHKPTEGETEKARLLAAHSGFDVHIFCGDIEIPGLKRPYESTVSQVVVPEAGPSVVLCRKGDHGWAQCPMCLSLGITYESSMRTLGCRCFGYIRYYIYHNPLHSLVEHCPEIAASEPSDDEKKAGWITPRPLFYGLAITGWWARKCDALLYVGDSPRLIAAYTAARQARFEFGERG